jgi:hypothetical protein
VSYHVVVIDEPDAIVWPELIMPDGGTGVPLFTSAEKARVFQQDSAKWATYRVRQVDLPYLLDRLRECLLGGVRWVVNDPADGRGRYTSLLKFLASHEDALA